MFCFWFFLNFFFASLFLLFRARPSLLRERVHFSPGKNRSCRIFINIFFPLSFGHSPKTTTNKQNYNVCAKFFGSVHVTSCLNCTHSGKDHSYVILIKTTTYTDTSRFFMQLHVVLLLLLLWLLFLLVVRLKLVHSRFNDYIGFYF